MQYSIYRGSITGVFMQYININQSHATLSLNHMFNFYLFFYLPSNCFRPA